MPILPALLIIGLLIAIGVALQWLPYGLRELKGLSSNYRFAYIVLLLRERHEYAGSLSLGESIRHIEPDDVIDSFFVVGTPALLAWFAARDAREYFSDSDELKDPPSRTQTDTRLLVYAGCVYGLSPQSQTSGLALLRQIASLPKGKHSMDLVRWMPRLSSPAISRQEGADWFGHLLAKTI